MNKNTNADTDNGRIKDPADWTTGDEQMTGAQGPYLHTLANQAGEEVEEDLTKAEASMKIEELREKTGKRPPRWVRQRSGSPRRVDARGKRAEPSAINKSSLGASIRP